MSVLAADDLHLAFGGQSIFSGLSFSVEHRDRVGVVGANGMGKSTLLRLLAGQIHPDGGQVLLSRGCRLAYLAQDAVEQTEGSLVEYLLRHAPRKQLLEDRLAELEQALSATSDESTQMVLAEELSGLVTELSQLDQDYGQHEAERILVGLGFQQAELELPLSSFSGGWRVRCALAAILFQRPDVLLLDEPTNHLDMASVRWLDKFLSSFRHALILICHDRQFLNKHVGRIVALEMDGPHLYRGNYDAYRAQWAMERTQLEAQIKKQEQKQKQLNAFIDRFKAKASKARQAQSKAKIVEKMEAERAELPDVRPSIAIRFPPCERAGDVVVELKDVQFSYQQKPLFHGLNLRARRQDRIVIMGRNGAGKTTLLRLIAKELTPTQGHVGLGHKVVPSYFAQHHTESLDAEKTVLEEVMSAVPNLGQGRVRDICGAFLFSGDDVNKPVRVLSGGERARVALARILVMPGNLLLLDEPTNHLDIDAADKLTESLEAYDGTLIFVSHNLDFACRLSNQVWDVSKGQVHVFPGALGEYLARLEAEEETAKTVEAPKAQKPKPVTKPKNPQKNIQEDKRLKALEAEIATLEADKVEVEALLASPNIVNSPHDLREHSLRHQTLTAQLEKLWASWLENSDAPDV